MPKRKSSENYKYHQPPPSNLDLTFQSCQFHPRFGQSQQPYLSARFFHTHLGDKTLSGGLKARLALAGNILR
jgi:hypothetical protein